MISFEGLPLELQNYEKELGEWLVNVAQLHGSRIINLSYRFLDEAQIRDANRSFLNHDYPTDIITFGYKEGALVEGDVLIGSETVEQNAERFNTDLRDEYLRVIAHGLLHLIGFNDQTEEEKEEMRRQEEKCLILQPKNLRYK